MAGLLVQNKFSPFLREILQLFGLSCCIVFLLLISSLGSDQQYRSDVVRNKDQDVGSHCPSESWAVSTCGCQGDRRGHHQKVIALSFDGNLSDQLTQDYAGQLGFVDQILSANYPNDGWILRIYTRNVERLQKANLFIGSDAGRQRLVDICDVKMVLNEEIRPHLLGAGDIPPNHWRFLPLLDPMVDLVISWDSSRPLTDREVGAVQEWLTTSADTSYRTIIKDFDSHCKGLSLTNPSFCLLHKNSYLMCFFSRQ